MKERNWRIFLMFCYWKKEKKEEKKRRKKKKKKKNLYLSKYHGYLTLI